MQRLSIYLLITVLTISILAGCSSSLIDSRDYPVSVSGVRIKKEPTKIVVLSDSLLDIIDTQNYDNKVVAVSDECTNETFSVLPKLGSIDNLDLKQIKSLAPSVILIDEKCSDSTIEQLSSLNIPLVKLENALNRQDFQKLYISIGRLMEGNNTGYDKGLDCAYSVISDLDNINRLLPDSEHLVEACYILDSNGNMIHGDSFVNQVFESAGAMNIAKSNYDENVDYSFLTMAKPKYIFCDVGLKEGILNNESLKDIPAVTNNHVYEIDKQTMTRQGDSIVKAATIIASSIYPQLNDSLKTLSPSKETENTSNVVAEESSAPSTPPETSSTGTESSSTPSIDKDITLGEDSNAVALCQTKLTELGYFSNDITGFYGEVTKTAVEDFQSKNGLEVNGVINDATYKLLFSDKATKK